jgi:ATP-dependent RNA helicase DeaD
MQIQYFEDLPLSTEVMKSLEDMGFNTLFPIQAQAIIPLLEGKDVIGQAKTGTGKTAAFGIPMIERLDLKNNCVQGLVLAPTRELAVQISDHIRQLGKYSELKVLPIYGGQAISRQIHALQEKVHVIVGTPGRTIDLIKRGILNLKSVRFVVLDEADRMLDMGFVDDIDYILSKVSNNSQTSLFSATIDRSVMDVCDTYLENPEEILVSKDEIALSQISQYYIIVNPRYKFRNLCEVIDKQHIERAIIFCRTRVGTSDLAKELRREGYEAKEFHGGFSQNQRDFVINLFRKKKLRLLVATDVAARGLDIKGITHVINYDVPLDIKVYFHRIGRTARKGNNGTAITFIDYRETSVIKQLRKMTNTRIEELEVIGRNTGLHTAICFECGKNSRIPFKPDPNRPVYCQDCWDIISSINII